MSARPSTLVTHPPCPRVCPQMRRSLHRLWSLASRVSTGPRDIFRPPPTPRRTWAGEYSAHQYPVLRRAKGLQPSRSQAARNVDRSRDHQGRGGGEIVQGPVIGHDRYESYMRQEQQRKRTNKTDLRMHACLCFIRHIGHAFVLPPL